MTETTAAPAPAEAKPNHGPLTMMEAAAQFAAKRASASAPPPAEAAPEPAAEESNPANGETAEATSVEGEAPEAEAATDEQTKAAEEPAGDAMELGDDAELILPDGSKWTAKELAEGVLRQKDYTRKTQALAEERRQLDSARQEIAGKAKELETGLGTRMTELERERDAMKAVREQYAAQVAQIGQMLNAQDAEWRKIDWPAERARDPQAAAAKWMDYQLHLQAVQDAEKERADLDAKSRGDAEAADKAAKEAATQAWQARRAELHQHVAEHHGILKDPERGNQEWLAMAETAKAAGFPPEVILATIGQTFDPNVPLMSAPIFELWRKATRYDQITAQKTAALASPEAPKPDATGRIKVAKATAPRFRPPSAADATLGRAQAAFNTNPSVANAVALEQAKRTAAQAKQQRA